jgi:hypothetical protein
MHDQFPLILRIFEWILHVHLGLPSDFCEWVFLIKIMQLNLHLLVWHMFQARRCNYSKNITWAVKNIISWVIFINLQSVRNSK